MAKQTAGPEIERLIALLARLPGLGHRSARKAALALLKRRTDLLEPLAAALAQVLANPASNIPMVGASGAISGVMGAYLILFPHVRVFTLVPLGVFITSLALPAWMMLIYWAVLQFFGGVTSIVADPVPEGTVWLAVPVVPSTSTVAVVVPAALVM